MKTKTYVQRIYKWPGQRLVEFAKGMQNTQEHTAKELAAMAGVPNYQTAAKALENNGIEFKPAAMGTPKRSALVTFARSLSNTENFTAREIAAMAGFPNYHSPEKKLRENAIAFKAAPPRSRLVAFAKNLPNTDNYTAREIAALAGLPNYLSPGSTLFRSNIPFKLARFHR